MIKEYCRYCTIVFDSYPSELTTKDHAHNFRTKKNGTGLKVEIRAYSKLDVQRKDELLSNNMNKQRFINFLLERFKLFGVKTVYANDYADLCYVSAM